MDKRVLRRSMDSRSSCVVAATTSLRGATRGADVVTRSRREAGGRAFDAAPIPTDVGAHADIASKTNATRRRHGCIRLKYCGLGGTMSKLSSRKLFAAVVVAPQARRLHFVPTVGYPIASLRRRKAGCGRSRVRTRPAARS